MGDDVLWKLDIHYHAILISTQYFSLGDVFIPYLESYEFL